MPEGADAPPVPGPTGGDMLRNLRWIQRDPLTFLRHLADRHGDLVSFPMPRTPALFVNHPDGARRVLQANHRGYGRGTIQYRALSYVTGGGLLTSDGERWLRHRRLMQPAFHRAAISNVVTHTGAAVDRRLQEWERCEDGALVDVDDAMMRTALEVVGSALFSTELSGDADRLVRATLAALDEVIVRARNPLTPPPRFPTPGNLRLRRALRTLDASVAHMVSERRAVDRGQEPGPGADLLGMLLAAHDDAGGTLTDVELRDEVVTTIVAGHETVASALTWTWHLLAGAPEVEERLHAEVDAVLGGRTPTLEDVAALPYTRAVLDEVLRLYPPAWLISRRAEADDVLLGHDVAAGSLVFLSPWVLHRHPGVWERPDEFDPTRFLPGSGGTPTGGGVGAEPGAESSAAAADPRAAAVDRFAYIPFGAGPNLCIGRDFALLEGVLVIATIAARYRFESVPGRAVVAEPLVTIRPKDGLPVHLRRR